MSVWRMEASDDRNLLAPVVQMLDSAIRRINHYPADNAIVSHNTYLLDSDLSGGERYPVFEQPEPGIKNGYYFMYGMQKDSNSMRSPSSKRNYYE